MLRGRLGPLIGLLAAAALASALLAAPALATEVPTAAPTLYNPAASSSSSTELRVHYYLPEPAKTGSVRLTLEGEQTFEIKPVASDGTAGDHELTIDVEAPSSSPEVLSASPSGAIPDGVYKFKLTYQAQPATETASVTHEHLAIITKTAEPLLISPAPESEIGEEFTVEYSLPEEAAPGTVELLFKAPGGEESVIALPATAKGTHTVELNPFDFAVGGSLVSGPEALSAGEYSLRVSYQDALLNAAAASEPTTFTFAHPSPAPSLLAPEASSVSDTPLLVRYDLPEAAEAATLTFNAAIPAEGTETDELQLGPAALTAGEHEFSLNVHSVAALSSMVSSATHASIADGEYEVKLEYTGVLATAPASVTNSGVVIKTVTHAPTIYQPANGSTFSDEVPIPIQFILPEPGAAGTVELALTPESGTPSVIEFASGSTPRSTLYINPMNITGSVEGRGTLLSGPNALAGGKYTATVSFQDQALDPRASSQSHTFTYERETPAPTLLSPTDSSHSSSPLLVRYELPEKARAESLKLTFEGAETVHATLATAVADAGEHEFSLDAHDLTGSTSTVASATKASLSDGTYKVTLEYEGEAASSPASASATAVVLDTATQAPSITAPASESTIGEPFEVKYTLPEAPLAGTVVLRLTHVEGATSVVALPPVTTPGSHSVTLNPFDLSADGTLVSGPASLMAGEYSLSVAYEDALGNPPADSASRTFTFAHPTRAPELIAPASGSESSQALDVRYDLPEAAAPGSLELKFEHTSPSEGTEPIEVSLAGSVGTVGEHDITLDGASLFAGSGSIVTAASPASIGQGSYRVKLTYEGEYATAAASSATVEGLSIIAATATPSIITPSSGTEIAAGADIDLEYSLPEAAGAGTVTLVFVPAEGSSSSVWLPVTAAGTHSVTLDPADLAWGGLLVSGPSALASGRYALDLRYQDAFLNPLAMTASSFTIESATPPSNSGEESSNRGSSGASGSTTTVTTTTMAASATGSGTAAHGPARLAVRWKSNDHPRELTVTFAPVTGARSYRMSVRSGRMSRSAACHVSGRGRRGRVKCLVRVPSRGRWSAKATAVGASGILADATTSLRFRI